MATEVSRLGYDVTIIGRHLGECCESVHIPFRTKRFRMIFRRGFLFYKFINIRLFFYLYFNRFDIIVANDLDTLLPNFLVSKLKRIPLVYDSHEYFTDVPEIRNRQFVKSVWTIIEKAIFPHLNKVMTVSDSISKMYEKLYDIRPVVIRNCSMPADYIRPFLKSELGIADDQLLIILQGGGINIDRGAEELVEAVSKTEGVTLFIAGSGDVIDLLKEITNSLNISDRIKFFPVMHWEELMRLTKSADAGITLDKDTCLNYRFSLPNKLFDYISAGIPVIASDLPEVRKIIDRYECGLVIPSVNADEIINALKKIRDNRDLLNKMKTNSVIASETLNWQRESEKVVEFYSNVLNL